MCSNNIIMQNLDEETTMSLQELRNFLDEKTNAKVVRKVLNDYKDLYDEKERLSSELIKAKKDIQELKSSIKDYFISKNNMLELIKD